jgi:hypothetical protein
MMQIHVGFEMIYDCPKPTPMIFNLNVHFTRVSDLVGRDCLVVDPPVPMAAYRDDFGNWCTRIIAPKGRMRVSADALVNDTGEDLREAVNASKKVLITGRAGKGKSWLGDKLGAIHLDNIGKTVGKKWIIPIAKLPKEGILEGNSDNMKDVVRAFMPDLVVYVDQPSAGYYKQVMALKASKDGPFKAYFSTQSKISDSTYRRQSREKFDRFCVMLREAGYQKDAILFWNFAKESPKKGWHESTV